LIKIINLVGARPQFVKAAAISNALQKFPNVVQIVVHSGQHYDVGLSEIFFTQLGLPHPKYHLDAPKDSPEIQREHLINAFSKVLEVEKPSVVVVYGDTTTTLAGAIAASRKKIPVAHIEAGLRSFNNEMPEEYNRVKTDQLSTFLYVPTQQGIKNLAAEGLTAEPGIREVLQVGDVMLDCVRVFGQKAEVSESIKPILSSNKPIALVTLHRNFNADNPYALKELILALQLLNENYEIAFPVHPRTRKALLEISEANTLNMLPPVSYFEMLALEKAASIIITDSGGVQKEAFFFKKPVVVLRPETEWTELVAHGVATLCPINHVDIVQAVTKFTAFAYPNLPAFYGDGFSADKICNHLVNAIL